jgi:DNA-binding transcriptional MerR regulator
MTNESAGEEERPRGPGPQTEANGAEHGRSRPRKTADAFRTISEVADDLHVPQHVLRFWETKFPQVRPLKRGGGRRYYRAEDVLLLRRVADLLYTQGYTIKGVQRLLREGDGALKENIPPASLEERRAAEAEQQELAQDPPRRRPPAPPELPIPGLTSAEAPLRSDNLRPAQIRPLSRSKAELEVERLRLLLTETLSTLEDLRRLLT